MASGYGWKFELTLVPNRRISGTPGGPAISPAEVACPGSSDASGPDLVLREPARPGSRR